MDSRDSKTATALTEKSPILLRKATTKKEETFMRQSDGTLNWKRWTWVYWILNVKWIKRGWSLAENVLISPTIESAETFLRFEYRKLEINFWFIVWAAKLHGKIQPFCYTRCVQRELSSLMHEYERIEDRMSSRFIVRVHEITKPWYTKTSLLIFDDTGSLEFDTNPLFTSNFLFLTTLSHENEINVENQDRSPIKIKSLKENIYTYTNLSRLGLSNSSRTDPSP